ncbi:MAG: hypothetical protein EPO11_02025 [Gammaproteobacteria bacterium]|nr:MAG: hypothetical protein EPO11_02025 [Gammaproteobacteria bacterium]
MKLPICLFTAVSLLSLSTMSSANPAASSTPSPLLPGTIVVADKLNHNEFSIVPTTNAVAPKQKTTPANNKQVVPLLEAALNQAFQHAHQVHDKKALPVKMASNQKKVRHSRVASKKVAAKKTVAVLKKAHHLKVKSASVVKA